MASNATTGVIPDATAFQNVGTLGVVFSALSALFGVYVVIFSLAVWLTFRRAGALYRNLRIVSIGLFTVLLAHYICRGIIFSQSRIINPPQDMLRLSTIPLSFIAAVTSTLAGLISDGLLAWRFYVVYGRHPWALWIPMSMIILNTCLGLAANFQILAFYSNEQKYLHFYQLSVLKVDVAWCWFTFAINTALTGAISGKIIYISQTANKDTVTRLYGGGHHNTALLAVVESALVTWIGLLMYGIASIAPTGGVTQALNVGFVMACIIPIFFGISQCLITAQLGLMALNADTAASTCEHAVGLPKGHWQSPKDMISAIVFSERKENTDSLEDSRGSFLDTV